MGPRFGILVFPHVQQLDLTGPYEVFASANGSEVHLIWKDRRPLAASTGLKLMPTTTFEECPPLDVLCVPGGGGVNPLLEDAAVLDFLRKQAAAVRYLTSVCTGALVLGAAGLLKGRRATTHWNAHDLIACFGAIPTEGRIVQDGNLITAGGVTSGIDFGLAVIAELFDRAEAETIQLALEYAPEPPFDAGTPRQAPPEILAAARSKLAASRKARGSDNRKDNWQYRALVTPGRRYGGAALTITEKSCQGRALRRARPAPPCLYRHIGSLGG